mmetsp:Transcript_18685/g.40670  ORF Transcript_18685/g.40670 Transcript_18685/m.40670 type:complete len:269 (-) Transcript_18685:20-826(-)
MILLGSVEGSPNGLSNEQAHGLDEISFVAGKAVVASFRQGHEVTLLDPDADPFVFLVANVKVSASVYNVANFFGVVDVFLKERLDFFVVSRQEVGADGNNVRVRISAGVADGLELGIGGVLGVPRNGLGGVRKVFGVHLPVGNAELLEEFDRRRLVGFQTVEGLLIRVGSVFHHVPGFGPFGVGRHGVSSGRGLRCFFGRRHFVCLLFFVCLFFGFLFLFVVGNLLLFGFGFFRSCGFCVFLFNNFYLGFFAAHCDRWRIVLVRIESG